jgi:hypothetical protein
MNFYSQGLGRRPSMLYHCSLPWEEAVWVPGKTETWESSGFLRYVKPPASVVFSMVPDPEEIRTSKEVLSPFLLYQITVHLSMGLHHSKEEG